MLKIHWQGTKCLFIMMACVSYLRFFPTSRPPFFCFGEPYFCHVSLKCHDLNGFGDWAQVFLRPHDQKINNRHTLPLWVLIRSMIDLPTLCFVKVLYNMLSTTKVTLVTYSWTRSQLKTLWILNRHFLKPASCLAKI
jgi:hypothetical protein